MSAPYGWARVIPPSRARGASKKHQLKCGKESISPPSKPPKMGWQQMKIGKPGSRGHSRMMRSLLNLQSKGGLISS